MKLIIEIPESIERISPTKRDRVFIMRAVRESLEKRAELFHEHSGQHQVLMKLSESNMRIEK